MASQDMLKKLYEYVYGDLYQKYRLIRKQELEPKWLENYNAYHKLDNAGDRWKSTEGNNQDSEADSWRSTTYVDISKQKTLSGANLVSDMVFKNGQVPFDLEDPLDDATATPVKDDYPMEKYMQKGLDLARLRETGEEVVLDGAIYGIGFGEWYIDRKPKIGYEVIEDENGIPNYVEIYRDSEQLMSSRITPWNMFWDLEPTYLRDADCIKRTFITQSDLEDMKDDPFINKSTFNRAVKNSGYIENNQDGGDFDDTIDPKLRNLPERVRETTILDCWVRDKDGEYIYCMICRGEVIKYTKVDKYDKPFFSFIWERNVDGPAGIGVCDNVSEFQKNINGAFRAFEDNKKLSGDVCWAGTPSAIKNYDEAIEPGKCFILDENVEDIREVLQQWTVADVGSGYMDVINLTLQMADMASNIPRASQGQESSNPQTAYEIQQRLERAGKYIGRVIANFDAMFIEPMVEYYYRQLMIDPQVPFELKYPYDVRANGFASYETRLIKTQKLMQSLQLIQQAPPEDRQRMKLDYIYTELAKSNDIAPELLMKTPEELQQDAQAQQAAQEQQNEMIRLEMEKQSADIKKVMAETKEIIHEINEDRRSRIREELGVGADSTDAQKGQ